MLDGEESATFVEKTLGERQGEKAEDGAVCGLGIVEKAGVIADKQVAVLQNSRGSADGELAHQVVPEVQALPCSDLDQGPPAPLDLLAQGLEVGERKGAEGIGSVRTDGDKGSSKCF